MDSIFDFEGRLNRARYFGRVLVITIITQVAAFVAGLFLGVTMGRDAQAIASIVGVIIGIAGAIITALQVVKRLHDLDRPGSHYWLLLIPFYNLYLGLVLLFKKGTEGPNQYGEDPLGGKRHSLAAGA